MAIIVVDPINGLDSTGLGTEGSPYRSINYALAQAATAATMGDTILLNPGIYREKVVVPASKCPVFFGRGVCIIDAENIRDCFEITSGTAASQVCSYWHNIIFRNPVANSGLASMMTEKNGETGSVHIGHLNFFNCTFYFDTTPGTSGSVFSVTNSVNGTFEFHHCTFKRLTRVGMWTTMPASSGCKLLVYDCIVDVTNTTQPFNQAADTTAVTNTTLTILRSAWPGGSGTGNVDLTTLPPPFTSTSFPDPDLSLDYVGSNIASYRGTGEKGTNIGSSWWPQFGFDMSMAQSTSNGLGAATPFKSFINGTSAISDASYVNGTDKGPAVLITDSGGGHWEIDTLTQASATSAAVLLPVEKILVRSGATATLRHAIWAADENEAPSSGSKKVIDSSSASSTRHVQYRASTTQFAQTDASPAWTDMSETDALTLVTFTADFWLQARVVLTTVGT